MQTESPEQDSEEGLDSSKQHWTLSKDNSKKEKADKVEVDDFGQIANTMRMTICEQSL
jgi:hypothetical protein